MRTRRRMVLAFALATGCCACSAPEPTPPPVVPAPVVEVAAPEPSATAAEQQLEEASERKAASAYRFDGFRLGDPYSGVMNRAPYDAPCDNDPIDERARRFMVYGGLPCRGRSFPMHTTVMFYIGYSDDDRYGQPIEALAWMGGDYFLERSDFPIGIGVSFERAETELGPGEQQLVLERKGETLLARKHAGDVYSLAAGDRIVGYVVGAMPADTASEQWRGLMQMYARYTVGAKPPATPAPYKVAMCCATLTQNTSGVPLRHKDQYLAAVAACRAIIANKSTSLVPVRAALSGLTIPAACR